MALDSLRGRNRSASVLRGPRPLPVEKNATKKWSPPARRRGIQILILLGVLTIQFHRYRSFQKKSETNSFINSIDYELDTQPDEKAYPVEFYPASCVYTRWPSGWGNEMMRTLHALISTARGPDPNDSGNHRRFACIQGYGGLVADMYSNIERCPPSLHHDHCYRGGTAGVGNNTIRLQMPDVRVFLATHLHKYPELLELNATFADEVFRYVGASYRVRDLQNSACGVHIRFGDIFSRKEEQMKEKDRKITAKSRGRACRSTNHTNTDDYITVCFEELVQVIRHKCPDPSIPIYIASDVPRFIPYFCERERGDATGRVFLSSCSPDLEVINHINDVGVRLVREADGYSIDPKGLPTVMSVMSDWLTLSLLKDLTRIGKSTFSESASLGFTAALPPR